MFTVTAVITKLPAHYQVLVAREYRLCSGVNRPLDVQLFVLDVSEGLATHLTHVFGVLVNKQVL